MVSFNFVSPIIIANASVILTRLDEKKDEKRDGAGSAKESKDSKRSSHLSVENDVIESLDTSESKSRSRRNRGGNYIGSNCLKVLRERPELVRRGLSSFDEEEAARRRTASISPTNRASSPQDITQCVNVP